VLPSVCLTPVTLTRGQSNMADSAPGCASPSMDLKCCGSPLAIAVMNRQEMLGGFAQSFAIRVHTTYQIVRLVGHDPRTVRIAVKLTVNVAVVGGFHGAVIPVAAADLGVLQQIGAEVQPKPVEEALCLRAPIIWQIPRG